MFTSALNPPYYAVIFTSILTAPNPEYFKLNDLLRKEAEKLQGFLGEDSAKNDYGISVSYWKDLESIQQWRQNTDHQRAKEKKDFYQKFTIRIAKVERDYAFEKKL
ncbi:MAG: antibiotic biosynthesis monooxygenase [Flavobacteriaceae bacterium]